jgi:NAD(P)H-dependent flavin oxidoreductase YrpB (nitropropane dioxygenase family)
MTRAVKNALAFQKLSGTPWKDVVQEGLAMRKNAELSLSQLVMAANTPMLLKAAMVDGRTDLGVMACGQVGGIIDDLPSCAELVDRIMAEAHATLGGLPTVL